MRINIQECGLHVKMKLPSGLLKIIYFLNLRRNIMTFFKYSKLINIISILLLGMQMAYAKTEISDINLVKPKSITVDKSLDKTTAHQMIRAARLFYTFWNTGDQAYLNAVITPNFIDNTLP